jgi:hypothetical protein
VIGILPNIPAIDPDRALELLRAEVEKAGKAHAYDGPQVITEHSAGVMASYALYVVGGEGCCLVGRALVAFGVPAEQLALLEGDGIVPAAKVLAERGVVSISEDAALVFAAAQDAQDEGRQWGIALDCAEHAWTEVGS